MKTFSGPHPAGRSLPTSELDNNFRSKFIKTFDTSNDYDPDDDVIAYYRIRKLIGTDATDYYYDEASNFPAYENYYAKMNDAYFGDSFFNGPIEYKRELNNRIYHWNNILNSDRNYQKAISRIKIATDTLQ